MARYKTYNYAQMKMVAVSYERQILPGTFEHTLNHLIDHDIDLAPFAARYVNDETGAPAYDPAILLKVILYAYSRGVTSSRDIAGLCRENIIFMALSADSTSRTTAKEWYTYFHKMLALPGIRTSAHTSRMPGGGSMKISA